MYAVPRQTAILPYKIGRVSTPRKCILEDVAREDVVVVSRKQVERRRALRSDPPATLSLSACHHHRRRSYQIYRTPPAVLVVEPPRTSHRYSVIQMRFTRTPPCCSS
jgi:hypothetical protein